jgi:hypothetical protein
LITGVVVLEARPGCGYLFARLQGTPTSMTEMAFGFGLIRPRAGGILALATLATQACSGSTGPSSSAMEN